MDDDNAEAEGLDDASSFGEELCCANGVDNGSVVGFDVGALFHVGKVIPDKISNHGEGFGFANVFDDGTVEKLDDGAGLFQRGAVVGLNGVEEVGGGVETSAEVVGLVDKRGDSDMLGDTVVETGGIDVFVVGKVVTALEVDRLRGDEGVEGTESDVTENDCFRDGPDEPEGSLVMNRSG